MQYPFIFYIFLFIHLVSVIIGFGSVLVVDAFGALWLFKKLTLSRVMNTAEITQQLIWIGWTGTIVSGIPLLLIKGSISNLTIIKLFLVLMVGFNGIFLHYIKKALELMDDNRPVPALWQFRMFLASAISQIGWWGALFIGFLNRHLGKVIHFTDNPFVYIGCIAGAILLVATAGELLFSYWHPASIALTVKTEANQSPLS